MNGKWKRIAASAMIGASVTIPFALQGYAAEPSPAAIGTHGGSFTAQAKLGDALGAEITSVLNEKVPEGTRIGVVVRMRNSAESIVRVPDYEMRVRTAEGVEYALLPSAANAKSIQPKASTELSFMTVLDRTDAIELTELNWTDVDSYVYPKKETRIAAVPLTKQPWKGRDAAITDPDQLIKWTDSFTIPYSDSPVRFTPVGWNKELREQGAVYILQLLAYNGTGRRETIPDFLVDGKSEAKLFSGKRLEKERVTLEAGEQKYIHYAIPTEQDTALTSLNVLTTETYVGAGAAGSSALIPYQVGRLNILLPGTVGGGFSVPYTLGEAMAFDPHSELIHPDLRVALVEFNMNDNAEEGSKTVTAKFLLSNQSDRPMAVPVFQTSLIGSDGYQYDGSRQAAAAAAVLPNSGITVNYAFTVPVSETGEGMTLKVEDGVIAAPYRLPIAAYAVQPQKAASNDTFGVYPFDVKLNSWSIGLAYNGQSYAYKGKLFLDIRRKNDVQADRNFPSLLLEVYDDDGRLVATAEKPLIGQGRLVTGENNIALTGTTEQFDPTVKLKIYEVFKTAAGPSKRLLADLTQ